MSQKHTKYAQLIVLIIEFLIIAIISIVFHHLKKIMKKTGVTLIMAPRPDFKSRNIANDSSFCMV